MTSLRQRMLEDMKVRNLAPNTQDSYIQRVSMFARHFGRSPETISPEEIRSYTLYPKFVLTHSWLGVKSNKERLQKSLQSSTRPSV